MPLVKSQLKIAEMRQNISTIGKLFFVLYFIFLHLLIAFFIYEKWLDSRLEKTFIKNEVVQGSSEKKEIPTPLPIPSITYPTPFVGESNDNRADISETTTNSTNAAGDQLMIPVLGVKREQLQDTFSAARSEGRVHNAIDIIAANGTPVVAAADGEIAKFFDSIRGGITIYQYNLNKSRVYYYAHLQKRADNLKETDFVRQGTIIGFVGDSGNAGAGNFHLHFSIAELNDPKRIFDGTEINPYPLLKEAVESH